MFILLTKVTPTIRLATAFRAFSDATLHYKAEGFDLGLHFLILFQTALESFLFF